MIYKNISSADSNAEILDKEELLPYEILQLDITYETDNVGQSSDPLIPGNNYLLDVLKGIEDINYIN